MVRPLLVTACLAGVACGDGPRRISLEPVPLADPACGHPSGGSGLLVTALGDGADDPESIEPGAVFVVDDFPAATRQLMVEVLGDGGDTVALGRTAPFALDELDDGTVLRVLMAPPDGACDVGALGEARRGPVVAAAGDDAVVFGGGPGQPLGTADWYDAAAGTFSPLELPSAFTGVLGTAGAAVVTMTDGRVVLIGGDRPVFAVLQPSARDFVDDGGIFELRGHHAAVALDHARIAVAGGCGALDRDTGACVPGTERFETFVVDIDTSDVVYGPTLTRERIGGALIVEPGLDGGPVRLVAVGGVDGAGDPVLVAERYDPFGVPADGPVASLADAGGIAAPLASGSTVVAFPDGAVTARVIVPGVAEARAVVTKGALTAAGRGVSLEDGSAIFTDAAGGAIVRYHPLDTRFLRIDAYDATWAGQGAARLPDGTVLLAGGVVDGDPTARAAVLRPSGDGPFTGAVTITPGAGGEVPLVPFDPALVDATPELRVRAAGDALASWLVVGGARFAEVELSAIVQVEGGAAVLLGFVDAGRFDEVELVAGEPARLIRRDGAGAAPVALCSGQDVTAEELATASVTLGVVARDGVVRVSITGRDVLSCEVDRLREGHVGLAPVGDGAAITLLTMALAR